MKAWLVVLLLGAMLGPSAAAVEKLHKYRDVQGKLVFPDLKPRHGDLVPLLYLRRN